MTARRSDFVIEHDVVERSLVAPIDGPRSLRLRFGTAAVDVRGLDTPRHATATRRFAALLADVQAAVVVDVVNAVDRFRRIDTRGWENTFALEHDEDHVVVVGRDFCSRIVLDRKTYAPLSAKIACTKHDDDFISPLENTLRVIAAYRCLSNGGALFHSASIVDDGAVRICFGASGIGKSTMARNWLERGRVVLGDELCAVEFDGDSGAFFVEQLPFAGDLQVAPQPAARFRLGALHRLAQGPLRLEPLPQAHAIAALASCAPFVNIDRIRAPILLDNLAALVRAHPPTRLTLGIDDDPRALSEAA